MLSTTGTPTALTAGSNADIGWAYTPSTAAALTAAEGTGYTLSDIGFQITRYDLPQSYYHIKRKQTKIRKQRF
jgi:hypothetical protein